MARTGIVARLVNKLNEKINPATEETQNDILTASYATLDEEKEKLHDYKLSDIDEGSSATYVGYLRKDGAWYIMKITDGSIFRYTKGDSGYDWSSRADYSYDYYDNVFN